MKNVMQRLERVLRSGASRTFAVLAKVGSNPHVKVGLLAAVLFAWACAFEAKAVLYLESSQNLFEVMH
jgi:hypothetical protein